ncbi:hypothetical protein MRB53_023073 [Persea americana]|uniref:Uncharacterized protein n=1 Tax=Persea americana TaxID=3435 RepID=A0ACC2L919_PERAE|nr:hypothetical protein MRB53_023073 [Persea americana]
MSRLPTFRRRFRNLVKLLYIEAMETYGVASGGGGSSKFKDRKSKSMNLDDKLIQNWVLSWDRKADQSIGQRNKMMKQLKSRKRGYSDCQAGYSKDFLVRVGAKDVSNAVLGHSMDVNAL